MVSLLGLNIKLTSAAVGAGALFILFMLVAIFRLARRKKPSLLGMKEKLEEADKNLNVCHKKKKKKNKVITEVEARLDK